MRRFRSNLTVYYEQVSPFLLGLCLDVLWSLGVVFVRKDFVGSKRELSPNRARHHITLDQRFRSHMANDLANEWQSQRTTFYTGLLSFVNDYLL
jgi:hypothetical protein